YVKPTWLGPLLSKVEFSARGHLNRWGLSQLLVFAKHYADMYLHWDAISALIEIWNPQTHTFIFSSFEATILFEETELLLGLKNKRINNEAMAHSVSQSSSAEVIHMITGDRLETWNIASPGGTRLDKLASWTMGAKDRGISDEKLAQALSLCLAGLFFFPNQNNILEDDFLGPMQGAWQRKPLTHAILAYLYSGLSLACLGRPFYGSVILLDIWLHLHIKMDFSKDETDSKIRTYDRCPIFRVRDALHYTDSMIIKTLRVRGRSEWREFLNDLPRANFVFSSEALDKLRLRVRLGQGVELRLVGGK